MRLLSVSSFVLLILLVSLPVPAATITGTVTETGGEPIVGASVVIMSSGKMVGGTVTAGDGSFRVKVAASVQLRVSALGFATDTVTLTPSTPSPLIIRLTGKSIDVGRIDVRPQEDIAILMTGIDKTTLDQRARTGLVPTNPVAAIKGPRTVRQGSQHSSKIRVNGTNPEYRLNRLSIGHDPTHYGVFSLLTSSVIDRAQLHGLGGDASQSSPAELHLRTIRPFSRNHFGEVSMSLTDLSGMTAVAGKNYYVLGSMRKSVLDKLVRYLDLSADRITLPPTNFQDIFVSAGYRLSPTSRIMIDHYDSRDHLSYSYQSSDARRDDRAAGQSTVRKFWGVTFEQVLPDMLLRGSLSRRTSSEEYRVAASDGSKDGLHVDLSMTDAIWEASIDATRYNGRSTVETGLEIEKTGHSALRLEHQYWNLQPPDAVSDNPYLYQKELNRHHDRIDGTREPVHAAGYISFDHSWRRFSLTSGLRLEHFNDLASGAQYLVRQQVEVEPIDGHTLRAQFGTYAEHPFTTILEPNQVMVHRWSKQLQPVRTTALSLGWSHRWVTATVSAKKIEQLPTLVPDFVRGPFDRQFITVQSDESASFYGFDVAVDRKAVLPDLDLYAFYGYTYGHATIPDATGGYLSVPHDLTSPHRMLIETTWHPGELISAGAELAVRSGYAYTPHYTPEDFRNTNRYTPEYYRDKMTSEHRNRFPTAMSLNLHLSFNLGRADAFLNLANVTNHANPIINTIDGYVYDAGILPTIGLNYRF